MDRNQERLMRETYARVHQLRVAAQQLTDQAEQLGAPWRNGPHQDQWAHLAEAVYEWSIIPNRLHRLIDRMPTDGMPGVYNDVERRNIYQAQLLADPRLAADRAIAAVDQQRAVDAIDAQVQHAVHPDGLSINALISAAHRTFSNPVPNPSGSGTDRHASTESRYAPDPDLAL
jgi:hypothetical protein